VPRKPSTGSAVRAAEAFVGRAISVSDIGAFDR
jgi:hypothetical protein